MASVYSPPSVPIQDLPLSSSHVKGRVVRAGGRSPVGCGHLPLH